MVAGILLVLVSTGVFSLFKNDLNSPDRYLSQINHKVLKALGKVNDDQNDAAGAIQSKDTTGNFNFNFSFSEPTYIYYKENLVYWSDHSFVPDYYLVSGDFHFSYCENSGSSFIAIKKIVTKNQSRFEIVSVVPLYKKYDITNQYIQSGFNPEIIDHPQISLFPSRDKPDKIYAADNTFLFSVEFYPGYKPDAGFYEYLFFFLLLVGLALTVTGIVFQTIYFRSVFRYGIAFIFLTLSLLVIRIIMVATDFPFGLIEIPVFDHLYYASSFINASLGDLFLNMLLLLSVIGFLLTVYTKKSFYRRFYIAGSTPRRLYSMLMAAINLILVLFIFRMVSSLSQHSPWNLDITSNLDYSFFKIFSYLLYFFGALIFFIGIFINNSIFFRLQKFNKKRIFIYQALAGLVFIMVTYFFNFQGYLLSAIALVLIVSIAYLDIRGIFDRLNYKTFVFVLIVAITCASAVSISVFQQVVQKNKIERDRFADQLLQERDVLTEYSIAEAAKNIMNDVFIQNRLITPFASKEIIEEKIKKTYLNNYLDRFDVNILLFNSQGLPINTSEGLNYDEIKSRFALDRYRTDYPGLYYYQQDQPVLVKRYLSFIPISRYDHDAGYIILDLKLKKIIRNKVYPRLLLDERFSSSYYEDQYDYAIYNNYVLSYTSGDFNYQKDFNNAWLKGKILFSKGIEKDGYRHQGYRGSNNKLLVITWDKYPVSYWIANFSFSFLIQIVGLLIFLAVYAFYFRLKDRKLNYMTRIQIYINLAFLIPLVIISIITISRISKDYSQEEQDTFLKKAESTGGNLISYLEEFKENRIGKEELYNQVADIANLTESDINIFGVEIQRGKLIATSQPAVFEKKLLSNYIDPRALHGIAGSGTTSMILDEKIGNLNYKSAYVAVKSSQSGELLGILSVPFFSSQASIERRIIDLIVSVINTFTIIFIAFLFISYVISTNLVFPLKQMISRIRFTSLSGNNQPIDYHSSDEIGQLVEAYNGMITKLEMSRKALAQSEKEAGWREMAKQVAHEIKNPLTPMKLTLQHLKMRIGASPKEENNTVEKAIDSMLLNIDTLNNIADSFSNYAKMPVPENLRFSITGLLKQVAGLYMNNDEAEVTLHLLPDEIYVKGDEYWLGRAFSNLMINSIQAVEGKVAEIVIKMKKTDSKILISFSDNGKGISESIRERIFVPNFSTKFTGSGIGLAVARRAVEHAGGKIWYESVENSGTTFFIELPIEA